MNFGWNMACCLNDDALNSKLMPHILFRAAIPATLLDTRTFFYLLWQQHFQLMLSCICLCCGKLSFAVFSYQLHNILRALISWSFRYIKHTSIYSNCSVVATTQTASQSEIRNLTNSYVLTNTAPVETHRKFVSKITSTCFGRTNKVYVCAEVCISTWAQHFMPFNFALLCILFNHSRFNNISTICWALEEKNLKKRSTQISQQPKTILQSPKSIFRSNCHNM